MVAGGHDATADEHRVGGADEDHRTHRRLLRSEFAQRGRDQPLARPADVGQSAADAGAVTWVVLTDPEGNEFCVLSPRD